MNRKIIQGFSKLSKSEKIEVISRQAGLKDLQGVLERYWHSSEQEQFDRFSENTFTNYYLPFGVAPNFLINNEVFHVPMVTEESSVVAAAASAAKFWGDHGGFCAEVINNKKKGHVYFSWTGSKQQIEVHWSDIVQWITTGIKDDVKSMEKRGGGLLNIGFAENKELPGMYSLECSFDTADAMGANFINTVLEHMGHLLVAFFTCKMADGGTCEIIMAILSNYTPDCIVRCRVETPVEKFDTINTALKGAEFARRMLMAVRIAETDVNRAVTHNKGIMNGIDAVVLATGNDFRAVEAGAHAYASRNGVYSSLSSCSIEKNVFALSLDIPLAVGTIGGLTNLHPIAKCALDILGKPSGRQLMMIIASVGLASHFSALRALVTSGIQKGHMSLHLTNLLSQLDASDEQRLKATAFFSDKIVSNAAVRDFLREN